jgi:CRP-like cAMP-binding protein
MVSARLPAATVDAICSRMRLREVGRRRVLHREGEPATQLYAIRAGRVKLFKVDEAGREHVTAVLESGDLFGFESVFGEPYGSSAATLVASELCLASDLKSLAHAIPDFPMDLVRYLSDRIARMHERQVYVAGPGARAKVAGFLLHHLPAEPGPVPVVTHHLNLREMGAALGLTPETVCRALSDLRAEGILDGHPGGARIRDLPGLRRSARPH